MSAPQWRRVFAVFEDALERPPDEQSGFLDQACGDDGLLRRTVEELLQAHDAGTSFLDQPVLDRPEATGDGVVPEKDADQLAAGRTTLDDPSDGRRPSRKSSGSPAQRQGAVRLPFESVGPYRLLRQIGQGGMSTVYLAVRDDDAFRRRVVIKVVRRDRESAAMLGRLRVERQILAGLEHPNIARLYDGGSTPAGIPYFVMEYVEGMPVDAYCEQNQLSIDQRLVLFSKVCAAVQYAHQNLVVHRDIKPSNILVTADGDPKLLDFGIAKLLNPSMVNSEIEPTANWQRLMTPSFASPEQIRGEMITTVSDVYSLGVLLYVLLTDRLPHQFEGCSLREIEKLITDTDPPKPSDAITKEATGSRPSTMDEAPERAQERRARVSRLLAGDLDAIVLKALRTAPAQRYGSVERFVADIDHFRSGRPVSARVGTWRYRSGKFVQRNRRAVVLASMAALTLASFGVAMALQARLVIAEHDKKAQVVALISEVFAASDPYVVPGAELTVREALERSLSTIEGGLKEQPEVRAELLHTTGTILRSLGADARAAEQLEEALAIRLRLHGDNHPEVARTMTVLAAARRGLLELDQAEELAKRAIEILEDQLGSKHSELAKPMVELLSVYCYREEYEIAEPLANQALALARQVESGSDGEVAVLRLLAQVNSARGEYAEAVTYNRRAVRLIRDRHGEKYPAVIGTLSNIGLQLRRMEDYEAAKGVYEEALHLQRETFGDKYADTILINNLAGVHFAMGDFEEAERVYRESLVAAQTTDTWMQPHIELRLARTLTHRGRPAEAQREVERLISQGKVKKGHWREAEARSILGESLSAQGRCLEAEPVLVESFRDTLERSDRARIRDDAFQRLRVHLERCGQTEEVAGYQAMLAGDEANRS